MSSLSLLTFLSLLSSLNNPLKRLLGFSPVFDFVSFGTSSNSEDSLLFDFLTSTSLFLVSEDVDNGSENRLEMEDLGFGGGGFTEVSFLNAAQISFSFCFCFSS